MVRGFPYGFYMKIAPFTGFAPKMASAHKIACFAHKLYIEVLIRDKDDRTTKRFFV